MTSAGLELQLIVNEPQRIEEPHEAWRLRLPDGREAHAMIVPRGVDVSVVWYIDGKVQGGTTTASWEEAVRAADRFRLRLEQRHLNDKVKTVANAAVRLEDLLRLMLLSQWRD